MFPGMGGLNPKKIQGMMKQLGIAQEEIDSDRVIIEKTDGSRIIITNPSVQKISMNGQKSFQITGDITQEENAISEEDIKIVMEKTGKTAEESKKALEETKDIAEAIIRLS